MLIKTIEYIVLNGLGYAYVVKNKLNNNNNNNERYKKTVYKRKPITAAGNGAGILPHIVVFSTSGRFFNYTESRSKNR